MTDDLNGPEKAAMLLTYVGEDAAAEVVKFLDTSDIQMLGRKVAMIANTPGELFQEVAEEFEDVLKVDSVPADVDGYIKSVVLKALGPEKASSILKRLSKHGDENGIETLKWMNPKLVADFVKNEHPQTIAVILANLPPENSAQVLTFLDKRTRVDIITRVATMESLAPGALEELEDAIRQNLSGTLSIQTRTLGGVKTAAEILNQIDRDTESEIIDTIEDKNAPLANSIQEEMFVFGDIAKIDDRGIQRILKEITNDQLILALKTAEEDLKESFLSNMSERAREMLLDEMESRGPVKLSDVNAAQLDVVRTTRKLISDGEIMSPSGEGEDALI